MAASQLSEALPRPRRERIELVDVAFRMKGLRAGGIAGLTAMVWAWAYGATLDQHYRAQVQQWRQQHEQALTADGGWLTVTGLFWLKDGSNTLGSAPDNDIVLPASAPPKLGLVKHRDTSSRHVKAHTHQTIPSPQLNLAPVRAPGADPARPAGRALVVGKVAG